MDWAALASDYDGTLARDGIVAPETVAALERLRASGRRFVLVTGRWLDIAESFPRIDLCDRVVAENGAVLLTPETGEARLLAPPPPAELARRLRDSGVPAWEGRAVVAIEAEHVDEAEAAIATLGLALHVVLNRGSAMVLPVGVDKGSGAAAALADLGMSPNDAIGVGDAENDLPLLELCGLSVAVADALPELKTRADLVTRAENGAGVRELIERLMADDVELASRAGGRRRGKRANPDS